MLFLYVHINKLQKLQKDHVNKICQRSIEMNFFRMHEIFVIMWNLGLRKWIIRLKKSFD